MFGNKKSKIRSKKELFPLSLSFFVIAIYLNCSFANKTNVYPLTPEAVVEKFCMLDADGNRLSSVTWGRISPLVTWVEEAGDMIFIIKHYKVGKTEISNSAAIVNVEYSYIGSTNSIDFAEKKHQKIIKFKLIKHEGKWKIKEPVTAPHVHWKIAIEYLKPAIGERPERKEQLELIISKIKKAQRK